MHSFFECFLHVHNIVWSNFFLDPSKLPITPSPQPHALLFLPTGSISDAGMHMAIGPTTQAWRTHIPEEKCPPSLSIHKLRIIPHPDVLTQEPSSIHAEAFIALSCAGPDNAVQLCEFMCAMSLSCLKTLLYSSPSQTLALTIFLPHLLWPLGLAVGEIYNIDASFRTESYAAMCSLYFDQLCVSVLTIIQLQRRACLMRHETCTDQWSSRKIFRMQFNKIIENPPLRPVFSPTMSSSSGLQ